MDDEQSQRPGRRRRRNRPRGQRRAFRRDAINRLLPNALTMLGLCAGLTAIRFGMEGNWKAAVLLIAAAALMDTLDGRMARLMGGQTEFGGQLDSLVDAIAFGVAPVVLVYMWSLGAAGGLGWVVTLIFAVCCVLRLARFNVTSATPDLPAWAGSYFSGVPAPAGAGLVLLPMLLSLQFSWSFLHSPWLTGPWTLLIAAMMISRLPTWSFKRLRVPQGKVHLAMAGIAAAAAVFITEPWIGLSGLIITYACTIPFGYRSFRRRQAEDAATTAAAPPTMTADGEDEVPPGAGI
jgi:CDP-diacylglycerol--serine O-phosphatidyltransferase